MKKGYLIGVVLAATAGVFWGSMGIAAEYLMRDFNFAALDLVSLRLLGAGVLLLSFEALRGQRIFGDFTRDGHWKAISIYGFIMLGVQATFFLAIAASNTATAALMVTTIPLFVAGWEALAEKRQLTRNEKISVGLAVIGVACIVTKGRLDTIDLSWGGVLWGLASSVFGAAGTLQVRGIVQKVSVTIVVGWAMTIGGAVLCAAQPPAIATENWAWLTVGLWFYIVAVGTVAAFCCYLKSLEMISASIASLVASFEPLSAVVLGVLWMGLTLNAVELCGIALIFVMVVVITRPQKSA